MKSNVYLASKPRYEILDGLRGVAAVLVVAYHLFETYYHGGTSQPINHGYLGMLTMTDGTVCRHGDLSNGGLSACIRW